MDANPYELLATAIVKQAAKDWRSASRRLGKDPSNKRARFTKAETEGFFRSGWFEVLSDLDGKC